MLYTSDMRLHHSLKHAFDGVLHAFSEHSNMRLHFLAGTTIILISFYLGLSRTEVVVLLFTIALVLITEMINTAIESMTDLITKDYRLEAKIAKDVSAGMVLLTACLSVIVGLFILGPHLLSFLKP